MRRSPALGRPSSAFGATACAILLAVFPLGCGGGGGGGGAVAVSVDVSIQNTTFTDSDAIADGNCIDPGPPNVDEIVSVTYTPVSPPGPPVTVPFAPAIGGATTAPLPGGLPPGTYSFQATYGTGALNETDQCPDDDVVLVAGTPVVIRFQH